MDLSDTPSQVDGPLVHFTLVFSTKHGAGRVAGWAHRGYRRAGRRGVGEKRISFLADTLSKLRFFGTS
jgi:hypothetical protein